MAGRDDVTVAVAAQAVDAHAGTDRELELRGIPLEVVAHLPPGRELPPRQPDRQPGQRVVARRREQPQRVEPVAPDLTDALVRFEDDALLPAPAEVVRRGQAG